MKKGILRFLTATSAAMLCAGAFAAASVTFDVSKQKISSAFKAQAKQARSDYQAGKFILAPFAAAKDITQKAISELLPFELDTLEASFFPDDTNWFDEKTGSELYGKMSVKSLSKEDAAAVELIRAEREKVLAGLGDEVKSGASVDLNGDGKKEKITYEKEAQDFGMKLKVGKASAVVDGFYIRGVRALDLGEKQKALLVYSTTDSDFEITSVYFYDGKKLITDNDTYLPGFNDMRYLGDGVFFAYHANVPVGEVTKEKLQNKKITRLSEKRAQKPLQSASMKTPNEYSEMSYALKCAALDGGTITFAPGEKLAVLTSIPFKGNDDWENYKALNEASVAVMNEQGKVGLFTTSEYGYCLAKPCEINGTLPEEEYVAPEDGTPYIYAISTGFVFLP